MADHNVSDVDSDAIEGMFAKVLLHVISSQEEEVSFRTRRRDLIICV